MGDCTHPLDSLHEIMLIGLTQALNLLDRLFVLLTLNSDGYRQTAHDERWGDEMIFGDGLQIGNVQAARGLLQHFGEVLRHESIQSFQRAETQNPVVGGLYGGSY
jgi:hypothetical protein